MPPSSFTPLHTPNSASHPCPLTDAPRVARLALQVPVGHEHVGGVVGGRQPVLDSRKVAAWDFDSVQQGAARVGRRPRREWLGLAAASGEAGQGRRVRGRGATREPQPLHGPEHCLYQ